MEFPEFQDGGEARATGGFPEFRDDEGFEPVVTRDLVLEERALADGAPDRVLVEGRVSYGAPRVARLTPPADGTGPDGGSAGESGLGAFGGDGGLGAGPLPDPSEWDLHLVVLPHTFAWPPTGRTFLHAQITFEATDTGVTAHSLVPLEVTVPVETTRAYTLSPQLQFMEIGAGLGVRERRLVFTRLEPVITAYGLGTGTFSWRYSGPPGGGVRDGSRLSAAVVQVPRGTDRLALTARTTFTVARRLFGGLRPREGHSAPHTFEVRLPGARAV
ncbi:hypothetical protein AB0F77_24260 [Streptomyces sp. NPDC026672]|uniref:hypothetical protein n=1 Tax=unclassified Streptomyces TaxID=2593676 RepID=UPI0033C92796